MCVNTSPSLSPTVLYFNHFGTDIHTTMIVKGGSSSKFNKIGYVEKKHHYQ